MVKDRYPSVNCLHFFSDGPATQYKQKGNFYLLSTEPHKKSFNSISCNFFETGHGKGASDGISGSLKRSVDTLVRQGKDIPDAECLYKQLDTIGTSVQLFYIENHEVETWAQTMLEVPSLATIKGTMKMHQVISLSPGSLKYRDISCLCKAADGELDCPARQLWGTQ